MKIAPFKAVYPNFDLIASADSFFGTVKYDYPQYVETGFFLEDDAKAFFIQQIITPDWSHTGILCCLDITDFSKGKILKHEKTLAAKEQKMTNLLLQRKAMIKPVLLTHRPTTGITGFLRRITDEQKPFYSVKFEEEEQEHRIYRIVDEKTQKELKKLFSGIEKLYIADGHHRISTSQKLYKNYKGKKGTNLDFKNLLAVVFAFDELEIHDYNRIVDILEEIKPAVLMARLSEICDITVLPSAAKPDRKYSFTMYMDHVWYELHWKPDLIRKYSKQAIILDADIVNKEIFRNILGMKDVRTDDRVKYVEGTVGIDVLIDKTQKGAGRVGFCLFPIAMDDLVAVADAGKSLPPKSTWFEPRIKNGLIAKRF